MDTIRADVSPVIDTQRCSLTTIHNRIDNQDSDGSGGARSTGGFVVHCFMLLRKESKVHLLVNI